MYIQYQFDVQGSFMTVYGDKVKYDKEDNILIVKKLGEIVGILHLDYLELVSAKVSGSHLKDYTFRVKVRDKK